MERYETHCEEHGKLQSGKYDYCPYCGKKVIRKAKDDTAKLKRENKELKTRNEQLVDAIGYLKQQVKQMEESNTEMGRRLNEYQNAE